MPSLSIDSHTRLLIASAILDAVGKPHAVRVFPLDAPELPQAQLLMISRCPEGIPGPISFFLFGKDDQDLFDGCLMVDVTDEVEAALKRDWELTCQ